MESVTLLESRTVAESRVAVESRTAVESRAVVESAAATESLGLASESVRAALSRFAVAESLLTVGSFAAESGRGRGTRVESRRVVSVDTCAAAEPATHAIAIAANNGCRRCTCSSFTLAEGYTEF